MGPWAFLSRLVGPLYSHFVPLENKRFASSLFPVGAVPVPSLTRARVAVTVFFALGGFLFAGWAVRIPAIKDQTDASARTLGLALLCMSTSAVATMLVTGGLCQRFGSRRVTVVASVMLSVSVLLPPLADSALMLGLTLLVFGTAFGAIDVAVNSAAIDLVTALRRPLMSTFHAANSIGSLVGAGLGGLISSHLSPRQHMLLAAPVGLLVTAVAGWMLLVAARPLVVAGPEVAVEPLEEHPGKGGSTAEEHPGSRVVPRAGLGVGIFGVIALCAAYAQGALDTWVPLHIREDLGEDQGLAAAGYATVALTIAVGRLCGTALLEHLGQDRVLVTGGLVACVGTVVCALAPVTWVVFIGLAVTGLGLANIFPAAMARAGAMGGPRGIAVASTLGYSGILLAPPTIGFLADIFSLPIALNTIALLVAVAAFLTYAARGVLPAGHEDVPALTGDGGERGGAAC